ncbi:hypothetical protein ACQP1U_15655 [Actinomycetota bacterium]
MARQRGPRGGMPRGASRSMVALLVSLTATALLAASVLLPRLLSPSGIADLEPGLFSVERAHRGVATLGAGAGVQAYTSGIGWSIHDEPLMTTVASGSAVSAAVGSVRDGVEHIEHHYLDNDLATLEQTATTATYRGRVYDAQGKGLPMTMTTTRRGADLLVDVEVPGADVVVLHLDGKVNPLGLGAGLDAGGLRGTSGWLTGEPSGTTPVIDTARGAQVAIGPAGADRAVDARRFGRVDVHVWGDRLTVLVRPT